tara:strand:- start:328 stop:546 length:219 start_codon:yes stop_codon:yes gene_type:complete
VKSRFTLVIKDINLGTSLEETLNNIGPTTSGGCVQSSNMCVTVGLIHIKSTSCNGTLHKGVHYLSRAKFDSN